MYPRWFYISSLASLQFSIPTVLRLLFNLNYVLFSYLFHRHSTDPSIIMNNRCHHLLDQITYQNCHELVNKCVNYWIILTPQRTCVTCPASKTTLSMSYSMMRSSAEDVPWISDALLVTVWSAILIITSTDFGSIVRRRMQRNKFKTNEMHSYGN